MAKSRSRGRRKLSAYNKFVRDFSKTYRGPAKSRMRAAAAAWRASGKSKKTGGGSRKSKKANSKTKSKKANSKNRSKSRSKPKKLPAAAQRYKVILDQLQSGKKLGKSREQELRMKTIALLRKGT